MIEEIKKQCIIIFNKNYKEMGIRIIKFNGSAGILRCNYLERENTIQILKSIKILNFKKVKIETIATSGTIKSLLNKHMKRYLIE